MNLTSRNKPIYDLKLHFKEADVNTQIIEREEKEVVLILFPRKALNKPIHQWSC